MTLGTSSDRESCNRSLRMRYGADRGSLAPDTLEIALFNGNPDAGGIEVSGGGYVRLEVPNDVTSWPDAPVDGYVTSAQVTFDAASGAWDRSATFFALFDADTGDTWDFGPLDGEVFVLAAGPSAQVALTVNYADPSVQ